MIPCNNEECLLNVYSKCTSDYHMISPNPRLPVYKHCPAAIEIGGFNRNGILYVAISDYSHDKFFTKGYTMDDYSKRKERI